MAVSVIFWTTVNAFDTPSDERVLQAPNGASRDRHQCVLAGHLARALERIRWPQTMVWIGAESSGDLLPPSPPAEKATASAKIRPGRPAAKAWEDEHRPQSSLTGARALRSFSRSS